MIKIICVGRIKEKFITEAINEYKKRLLKYTKIEIIEVSDMNLNNEKLILEEEKKLILKHIDSKDYIISLAIEGKDLSSTSFSKKIDEIYLKNSNIVFIIGGSYGLHHDIKNISDLQLSFSKMTFPHQLFRLILIEQIYRAFKINKNESYHK